MIPRPPTPTMSAAPAGSVRVVRPRTALAFGLLASLFTAVILQSQEPPAGERVREEVRPFAGEEVSVPSGDATLFGRLWLPDGPGPFPAFVFIPGSGRSISDLHLDPQPLPHRLVDDGIAFLAFDKRGVRNSTGRFEALSDTDAQAVRARLELLAHDALAAVAFLRSRAEIDAAKVGVYAFSQGGWVLPVIQEVGTIEELPAAAIVVGGPAVSIGEELAYSELAHRARDAVDGSSDDVDLDALYEQHDALARARPGGRAYEPTLFDPLPLLRDLTLPSLWLLGERDLSVPTRRSVEVLAGLEAIGRPVRHVVLAEADHGGWRRDAEGEWQPAGHREATLPFLEDHGMLPLRVEARVRWIDSSRR